MTNTYTSAALREQHCDILSEFHKSCWTGKRDKMVIPKIANIFVCLYPIIETKSNIPRKNNLTQTTV